MLYHEIEDLVNKAKKSTEGVLKAVYEIGRWWLANSELLGTEIGDYELMPTNYGDKIIYTYNNRVLGMGYDGNLGNFRYGSQDNHIRFLEKFPIALKEKLISIINDNQKCLDGLDDISKFILNEQEKLVKVKK